MQEELLREAIREKGMSITGLSKVIHMDMAVLQSRIRGTTEFKISEMLKISKTLGLSKKKMSDIFLTSKWI